MRFKSLLITLLLGITLTSCVDKRDPNTLVIGLRQGIDTIEVNTTYVDPGAYAYLENKVYRVSVVVNQVDTTQVGSYTIVYRTTFKDRTLEITRYVDVIDETPPQVTLLPGIDTIYVGQTWVDAGVATSDNSGLAVEVEVQGEVITSQIGEYQIYYIVRDAYDNTTTKIRYVHVLAVSG